MMMDSGPASGRAMVVDPMAMNCEDCSAVVCLNGASMVTTWNNEFVKSVSGSGKKANYISPGSSEPILAVVPISG
jgi:hypothetical protein